MKDGSRKWDGYFINSSRWVSEYRRLLFWRFYLYATWHERTEKYFMIWQKSFDTFDCENFLFFEKIYLHFPLSQCIPTNRPIIFWTQKIKLKTKKVAYTSWRCYLYIFPCKESLEIRDASLSTSTAWRIFQCRRFDIWHLTLQAIHRKFLRL